MARDKARSGRSVPPAALFTVGGWVLRVVGLGCAVAGFARWKSASRPGPYFEPPAWWQTYVLFPLLLTGGGLLFLLGQQAGVQGRRRRAAPVRPAELAARSFVLYLRPFEDDRRRAGLEESRARGIGSVFSFLYVSGLTEEEQLTRVLAPVAPVVAVGEPGERLPLAGARRFYLPLDDWQDTVSQLMGRARLVVLTAGLTAGVLWEIGEAARKLPPERLVVLVPMDPEAYETFRARAGETMPRKPDGKPQLELPEWPADSTGKRVHERVFTGAIWYGTQGEPHFVRLGLPTRRMASRAGLRIALREGLCPVIDRARPGRHR
ncbi:hypothetical protein [Streptomyces violascens]|uniref:Uncharacterized protein n=1 Tax=Streptomyces violascens TaxID=67381 RepID=A0ABQ3QFH8_9ACTN|nr:hypothetical protein [Streptomyces violascens]GGT86873.1 hypothetical protein GCM10010289_03380 [Streptomyces violascens]GHI36004.1 hypothetical protein Sviol_04120 [Streptomyces violascens]